MIHWQELHIGLDQVLDKQEAKIIRAFEPEEKDWWLNTAQLELLKPSFEQELRGQQSSQRRIDKQEELINRVDLTVFTYNDLRRVYCYLPSDYLLHESSASKLDWNCNTIIQKPVAADLAYAILPFPTDTGGTPFYSDYSIWLTVPEVMYRVSTRPAGIAGGVTDLDLRYQIANDALDTMQDNVYDLKVYWEKFGNIYASNSFIFVSEESTPPVSISWGWALGSAEATVNFTTLAAFTFPDQSISTELWKPNRVMPSGHSHDITQHAFARTSYKSPACFIRDGLFEIQIDNTFNPRSVELEYMRRPKNINYLVEQGSELNRNMYNELINLAAELMLDSINSGQRQQLFKQNLVNN